MDYLVNSDRLRESLHHREVTAGDHGLMGLGNAISIVIDWAVAEGRRYGNELLEVMEKEEREHGRGEAVRNQILRQISRGPDDKWSGRGNDLKRAFFDGFLRSIQDANII